MGTFRVFGAIGTLLLLASIGCAGSPHSPSASSLTGIWGGDHATLTVTETGSHLEFDCAHGEIPDPLTLDAAATFSAAGTYVREHGGPIRESEVPDAHPAIYHGTMTGATIRLSVRITDTNDVIGTFTLARDNAGRVLKCL
jgi:hypothetical protein